MQFLFGSNSKRIFDFILRKKPDATARIRGSDRYPSIRGAISFYQTMNGVLIIADISGLPISVNPCEGDILGFHIHEGNRCSGKKEDVFANAGGHYNPNHCEHPFHAGDMPPLFVTSGNAFLTFVTNRFAVKDIVGKTVIIHEMADDMHTQPSGRAGDKIACGVIRK